METWQYGYLSKTMKWKFGNTGAVSMKSNGMDLFVILDQYLQKT